MNGFFVYAGKSSRDFGILIDDAGSTFGSARRDYSVEEIPGRNGDLTIDNGRWKNTQVTYSCGIGLNFKQNMDGFRAFLTSCVGYNRLEDTFHPGEFRLARVAEELSPDVFKNGKAGTFDVVFDAKPQRYLKIGEIEKEFTASGSLRNPTLYASRPLLRVYGTGTFGIGSTTMQITSASTYTDIDCDAEECYKDTAATNCNGNVILSSGTFPTLEPGTNGITLGTGITKIIITPRWETL